MTDEQNNKTPAAESKTPPHKNEAPHRRKRQRKSSAWGWLLLVLIAGLAVGGGYGYRFLQGAEQSLNDIGLQQQALASQNQALQDELDSRLLNLQKQQRELTGYIEVMREKDRHLRKDWLILESEYLLQLANYRLLFDRDVNTALAALQAADTRLRDTGDPGLVSVRKKIAEAILSLKGIAQVDLAGLSLSLSAISKELDTLPLRTPDPKSRAVQQQQQNTSSKVESWSELPAAMWQDIKSLIVIRDHDQPIEPLLTPKERFFLIENLRLQIEQARLALLSGQQKVYKERLETAVNWINEHFDREQPITRAALETLHKLEQAPIAPKLPDIAYTYQALKDYRLGRSTDRSDIKKTTSTKPAPPKPQPKVRQPAVAEPAGGTVEP